MLSNFLILGHTDALNWSLNVPYLLNNFSTTFRNVDLYNVSSKSDRDIIGTLHESTLEFSISKTHVINHYEFPSGISLLQTDISKICWFTHCKYNIVYFPAEYFKTGFERHTIIVTIFPRI